MSQENVEIVRSVIANWERGDYTSAGWAHPDIEAVIADGPSPRESKGLSAMAEGWGEFLRAWEGFRHRVDGFRELGGGRVLVLVHWSGRGKTSGLDLGEMQAKGAVLFQITNEKVTKLVAYLDRGHALKAVGLSEQDAHADS